MLSPFDSGGDDQYCPRLNSFPPPNRFYQSLSVKAFRLVSCRSSASHRIMHRDINPYNLVIISFNPPQSRVTDFGGAITTNSSSETQVGKLQYRAPEMWRISRSGEAGVEVYDKKVDMFAFGVSAYQLFCKRPTWWGEEADIGTVGYMKDEIRAQKGASPHVKKLIRSMLVDDADLRPSAQQVRNDPDFTAVPGNQG